MPVVVDASALGAVVFGEPDGPTITAHLAGETLLAPTLIDYELASIALKKVRRDPDSRVELLAAAEAATHLPITRIAVRPLDAIALAVNTGLTVYDASYLWVAISRGAELVTLDRQLARVNQARG